MQQNPNSPHNNSFSNTEESLNAGGLAYRTLLLPVLHAGMNKLDNASRDFLFAMYFSEEFPLNEQRMAKHLQCAVKTVIAQKQRCLSQLQHALRKDVGWQPSLDDLLLLLRLAGQSHYSATQHLLERQHALSEKTKKEEALQLITFFVAKEVMQKRAFTLFPAGNSLHVRFLSKQPKISDLDKSLQASSRGDQTSADPPGGIPILHQQKDQIRGIIGVDAEKRIYVLVESTDTDSHNRQVIMEVSANQGSVCLQKQMHTSKRESGTTMAWYFLGRLSETDEIEFQVSDHEVESSLLNSANNLTIRCFYSS